jgi:hypothetical protein
MFDQMWRAPKIHLAAGAFIANEAPLETIMMCMLLEQYKKIQLLETELRTSKNAITVASS